MLEGLRSIAQSIFSRNPLGPDHHYFYDDVIDYFNSKIKSDRNDVKAYLILGKLLRLKGQAQSAFKLHANLLSHPKMSKKDLNHLYLEIGFDALHAQLDDFGIEHFEKALLFRQTAPLAHYGLYKAYDLKNNHEKTRKHLEILVKQNHAPKDILIDLYIKHLNILKSDKDSKNYLNLSEKAIALNSEQQDIQVHHACALYKNKHYKDALNYIDSVIASSPYSSELLKLTEDIFYAQNTYSDLEYQLKTWLKKYDHPNIHILMAKLLQKKHKYNLAKDHLYKAFTLDPKNPEIFLAALNNKLSLEDIKQFQNQANTIKA